MPERDDHQADDDKPPPTVASLKSGLGWTDPDRHRNDPTRRAGDSNATPRPGSAA